MYACIILHNMILEDQEHTICGVDQNDFEADEVETQISKCPRSEKPGDSSCPSGGFGLTYLAYPISQRRRLDF